MPGTAPSVQCMCLHNISPAHPEMMHQSGGLTVGCVQSYWNVAPNVAAVSRGHAAQPDEPLILAMTSRS